MISRHALYTLAAPIALLCVPSACQTNRQGADEHSARREATASLQKKTWLQQAEGQSQETDLGGDDAHIDPIMPNRFETSKKEDSKDETFYALPGLDHGLIQSPVNILSSRTMEGNHRVELHVGLGAEEVINTGHTIEVEFPRGTTADFDGKTYELKQLHFHTPSEHQIDGVTYPMEMHIVHQRTATPSASVPKSAPSEPEVERTEEAEYLVFGVLFKMGKPSRFIAHFLDAVPSRGGEHARVKGPSVEVTDVMDHLEPYYHYNGSLTTPPYTESVTWLVGKEPAVASMEQIQKINQLEGNNARHVQATYGRVIDG